MPHQRPRQFSQILIRKLKFSRVVSIQGARQTGKSFFARELLGKMLKASVYLTFDQKSQKSLAENSPESFLKKHQGAWPLIIDEAQKVPDIFDAIKYQVDLDPRPGQLLLLGSSEFSREAKIRESLTGRLSKLRVFPFNLSETLSKDLNPSKKLSLINQDPRVDRKQLLRYLDKGGFPGTFSVRQDLEVQSLFADWVRLTTERDLSFFQKNNPDPELAMEILQNLPLLEEPNFANLAKKIGYSSRRIQTHLKLLTQLFCLHKLSPHPLGSGKELFFLCDPGIAGHFGASLRRKLTTWLLLEFLSQNSYKGLNPNFYFYRSSRGGIVDLVVEDKKASHVVALKIIDNERMDTREFEILNAFRAKASEYKSVELIALAPVSEVHKVGQIQVCPWEVIV